jgi:hypothetical protein
LNDILNPVQAVNLRGTISETFANSHISSENLRVVPAAAREKMKGQTNQESVYFVTEIGELLAV